MRIINAAICRARDQVFLIQRAEMPSIKKRVTGFIRQLSAPSGASSDRSDRRGQMQSGGADKKNNIGPKSTSPILHPVNVNNLQPECFIQRYLNG